MRNIIIMKRVLMMEKSNKEKYKTTNDYAAKFSFFNYKFTSSIFNSILTKNKYF